MDWRIFVDASVIEVFVNDRVAFSTRSYPSAGSTEMDLFAEGGTATASEVNIYDIAGGGTISSAKSSVDPERSITTKVLSSTPGEGVRIELISRNERPKIVVAFIYDQSGVVRKTVYTSVDNTDGTIFWDGRFDDGSSAAPGVYFLKGVAGNQPIQTTIKIR
jgi:hypothetical protein